MFEIILAILILIIYLILKFYIKYENSKVYFFYNIVAEIIFIILFASTLKKGVGNYFFYFLVLAGFMELSLSATEGIEAKFFKNILIEGCFVTLLAATGVIYISTALSIIPSTEDNWSLGFIATIMMLLPHFIHLWRLIHISKTMPKILLISIENILTLQFMLYYGLGMTVFSEKHINTDLLSKGFFDPLILIINIGMSSVIQFPGVENGNIPTTRMTLAYCIGNFVNFIIVSFVVAYIVSVISDLKQKDKKAICLGGISKK